jgi:hypothetical protein
MQFRAFCTCPTAPHIRWSGHYFAHETIAVGNLSRVYQTHKTVWLLMAVHCRCSILQIDNGGGYRFYGALAHRTPLHTPRLHHQARCPPKCMPLRSHPTCVSSSISQPDALRLTVLHIVGAGLKLDRIDAQPPIMRQMSSHLHI